MLRKGFYLLPSLTRQQTALTKAYTKNLFLTNKTYFSTTTNKKNTDDLHKEIDAKGELLGNLGVIKIVNDKNNAVEEISKQKDFPDGALLAGALVTAPLLLGSISLNIFTLTGTFASSMPTLFMSLLKYSGLHLAFMVIFLIIENKININSQEFIGVLLYLNMIAN